MESQLQAALQGLALFVSAKVLLAFGAGLLIGLAIGALPGLGGLATLALLMPSAYTLDPPTALALIMGAYGAVSFGGSVTAILFNTPGTGEQVVTAFDGYPMTRAGKGARALGISATASAFGGLFGVLILLVAIPFARSIILSFRPPEIFVLGLTGVLAMGIVGARSIAKGIASGMLGLMLSFIGYDPITGIVRLTFGSLDLYGGLSVTGLTLGLFAIAEMFSIFMRGTSIAGGTGRVALSQKRGSGVFDGMLDVLRNWRTALVSGVIGVIAGIIPGMGGTVAMFLSYGWAARNSKHPEQFGKGAPEGVLAAESANNAKEGGSLLPTLAFGIPGSSGMALVIGIFLVLGYVPGPQMMARNLDIVFYIAWIMAFSNLFASLVGLGVTPLLARLTRVQPGVLAPALIALSLVGAFLDSRTLFGIAVTVVAGFAGYFLRVWGYSNAGVILGFVLGPLIERNFFIAIQAYGASFLVRPVTLTVIGLVVLFLYLPSLGRRAAARRMVKTVEG